MSEKDPASSIAPPTTRIDLAAGLTEFPREVFDHADSLEVLNLTGNRLSSLPDDLGRLKKLRILFCSNNQFTRLPAVLGTCPSLTMVGFRANQIEEIEEGALPRDLEWLILTENRLRELPAALGNCRRLQKLMLSGNSLATLPAEMVNCENLELLRLAANQFDALPEWLLRLPRLAWLALAGNPMTEAKPDLEGEGEIATIPWSELALNQQLGEGASGVIHRAEWQRGIAAGSDKEVAVKIFKGAMTSDGLPASEMAASLGVGEHPHLTRVLGRIGGHPDGAEGIVMRLIDPAYANLAGPPSFETCTRDVYAKGVKLSAGAAVHLAHGIASAAVQLHEKGILHGDLYAHNILYKPDGECLLSDFGAAAFYDRGNSTLARDLERVEVRAFGYLLEELVEFVVGSAPQADDGIAELIRMRDACCLSEVVARPSFLELKSRLSALVN